MTDRATLEKRLAEAEAVLHRLQLGQHAVSVSYDGEVVTYTQSSITKLQAYILLLKRQLDPSARGRRAIGVRGGL